MADPILDRPFLAKWWRAGEPIPEGWHLGDDLKGTIHHNGCGYEGRNFILIVKPADGAQSPER